jgi:hypothetical protein
MSHRDVGCSQEDHIPNCGHFGYSGVYLSDHLETCPCYKSNKAECNCNPTARKSISRGEYATNAEELGSRFGIHIEW